VQRGRPRGLTVLACIQFLFVLAITAGFIARTPTGTYPILSQTLTVGLMLATAIGYLRQSYRLGFIGGNILAVGSLVNVLAFNASEGFQNITLHVPSMVYPALLLLLLNLRYRAAFATDRSAA
jgi:hypothetical protein